MKASPITILGLTLVDRKARSKFETGFVRVCSAPSNCLRSTASISVPSAMACLIDAT
jgi:hypothetical protein